MGITIGDAILWIRGNNTKLDGDLRKVETQTKSVLGRIGASFKESMNFAVGQVMAQGLNQLAHGIENMTREVIDLGQEYAQQVEDMARLSGATVEDSSRIIQVADDMRVSYEEVSTALKMYAKTQTDAGKAAKMDVDALANLSDQYLKLAPGVDRANFLLENFGRAGLGMGKMMEQGGEKIRDMSAAVDDSLVMTQEGIDQAEEYRLAMDEWDDSIKGVKLSLAQALLPSLNEFIGYAKTTLIPVIKTVVEWFTQLPAPVKGIIIGLGGLLVLLIKLGPMLMGIAGIINLLGGAGGFAAIGGAVSGLLGVLGGIPTAIGAFVLTPIGMLLLALGVLLFTWQSLGPQATETFSMIANIIAASLNRAGYEIKNFLNGPDEWNKLPLIFEDGTGKLQKFLMLFGVGEEKAQSFLSRMWVIFSPNSGLPFLFEDGTGKLQEFFMLFGVGEEKAQSFASRLWVIFSPNSGLPFLFEDGTGKLQEFFMLFGVGEEKAQNFASRLWVIFDQDSGLPFLFEDGCGKLQELLMLFGVGEEEAQNFGAKAWLAFDKVRDSIRNLISSMKNIGESFKAIGKSIVDGMWTGIQSAWEGLKTKVATAITDLVAWIKEQLGIASPSLVMALQVGRPMGEGIGLGLQESMRGQVQQIFQLGVQGMTLAGAQAAQSINVAQLIVDSRLSQRERDYWDERSERIAEKSTLRWLKRLP